MKNRWRGARRRLALSAAAALAVLVAAAPLAQADIVGVRAYGMGGAFTAVADDYTAIYWNPAGLGGHVLSAGVGATGLNVDALEAFISIFSDPDKLTADHYVSVNAVGGISSIIAGAGAVARAEVNFKGLNDEATAVLIGDGRVDLAAGARVPFLPLPADIGVAVKRITGYRAVRSIGVGGTVKEDWEGRGFAVDLGVRSEVLPLIAVGAAVRDAFGSVEWTTESATQKHKPDSLSRSIRVGAALKPPLVGLIAAADYDLTAGSLHLGGEFTAPLGLFSVRAGLVRTGDEDKDMITFGAGLGLGPVKLNGAMGRRKSGNEFSMEAAFRF